MDYSSPHKISVLEYIIIGAIIVVIGVVSVWAVSSTRSHSRDVVRMANMKEVYYGLELYFDALNDYPKGSALVLGGPNAGSLDEKGFHSRGSCSGRVFLPMIAENPTPKGAPFVYNFNPGPPSSYQTTFSLEGGAGGLAAGKHSMTPTGLQ